MSNTTTTQAAAVELTLTPKKEFFSMETAQTVATTAVVTVVATVAAVVTAHYTRDYLRGRDSVETVSM